MLLVVAVAVLGGLLLLPMCDACYSKRRLARRQLDQLAHLVEEWRGHHGPGCPDLEGLLAPRGTAKRLAVDPWGSRFLIRCSADGEAATLMSVGPDSRLGTKDDLIVHR